jgi:predicted RNA-binding Zn-ribbon protein involved in translation (DUF1610 family)
LSAAWPFSTDLFVVEGLNMGLTPDPNVLRRSEPCAECGEMMLWTQNACTHGDRRAAAYRCLNGHVLDPATTHECPACGVHDTRIVESRADQSGHVCNACGARFDVPRAPASR